MSLPVKVLETLKILLGVSLAVGVIWGYVLPFDPNKLIDLIDVIIIIITPAVGMLIAGPALSRQLVGRFTRNYITRKDGQSIL